MEQKMTQSKYFDLPIATETKSLDEPDAVSESNATISKKHVRKEAKRTKAINTDDEMQMLSTDDTANDETQSALNGEHRQVMKGKKTSVFKRLIQVGENIVGAVEHCSEFIKDTIATVGRETKAVFKIDRKKYYFTESRNYLTFRKMCDISFGLYSFIWWKKAYKDIQELRSRYSEENVKVEKLKSAVLGTILIAVLFTLVAVGCLVLGIMMDEFLIPCIIGAVVIFDLGIGFSNLKYQIWKKDVAEEWYNFAEIHGIPGKGTLSNFTDKALGLFLRDEGKNAFDELCITMNRVCECENHSLVVFNQGLERTAKMTFAFIKEGCQDFIVPCGGLLRKALFNFGHASAIALEKTWNNCQYLAGKIADSDPLAYYRNERDNKKSKNGRNRLTEEDE